MRNVNSDGGGQGWENFVQWRNIYKLNFLKHNCHSFVLCEYLSCLFPKIERSPTWWLLCACSPMHGYPFIKPPQAETGQSIGRASRVN